MDSYKVVLRTKDGGSAKYLLTKGVVPGILYGRGEEPIKIAFEEKILKKLCIKVVFTQKFSILKLMGR